MSFSGWHHMEVMASCQGHCVSMLWFLPRTVWFEPDFTIEVAQKVDKKKGEHHCEMSLAWGHYSCIIMLGMSHTVVLSCPPLPESSFSLPASAMIQPSNLKKGNKITKWCTDFSSKRNDKEIPLLERKPPRNPWFIWSQFWGRNPPIHKTLEVNCNITLLEFLFLLLWMNVEK